MPPSGWEIAAVTSKWLVYAATAMVAGAWLHLGLYDDGSRRRLQGLLGYALAAALLGFHAALVQFLVQVGQISARGLAGMLDWAMVSFVLETPTGATTLWRLAGFVTVLVIAVGALWWLRQLARPPARRLRSGLQMLLLTGLLLVLWSYRASGHVSVLPWGAQLSLVVHVLVFAVWIGALPPFLAGVGALSPAALQRQMTVFGNQALVLVGLLAAAGLYLLFALLAAPAELWTTDYGWALLLKFVLVLGILGIAALNRYRLVPALGNTGTVSALRHSLLGEVGVATAILAVTAFLSTLLGPPQHPL